MSDCGPCQDSPSCMAPRPPAIKVFQASRQSCAMQTATFDRISALSCTNLVAAASLRNGPRRNTCGSLSGVGPTRNASYQVIPLPIWCIDSDPPRKIERVAPPDLPHPCLLPRICRHFPATSWGLQMQNPRRSNSAKPSFLPISSFSTLLASACISIFLFDLGKSETCNCIRSAAETPPQSYCYFSPCSMSQPYGGPLWSIQSTARPAQFLD